MLKIPLTLTVLLASSLTIAASSQPPAAAPEQTRSQESRAQQIDELRSQLKTLAARLDALERRDTVALPAEAAAQPAAASQPNASAATETINTETSKTSVHPAETNLPSTSSEPSVARATPPSPPPPATTEQASLDFFKTTTLNISIDGYYGYNFNRPLTHVNLLRAYDVTSNSFNLSQASLIVEHLPLAQLGQRFGGRVDLQYGQATETLQGSPANELRPQVWRNLFQAYGSYLAPVGTGLQIDFGKWASTLGVEGNYTKDQINYSRSYLFNYLPFYHMGFRANYNLTPKINVAYWLVNGAQQTEDFNGFKSQAFIFTLKPTKTISWNVNYYFGQEQRDPIAPFSTSSASLPPGALPAPTPNGREHIFDTYATWNATPKLTFLGEADYVINRVLSQSAPAHVSAGAIYARYALPRGSAIATRGEYLSDRGGLFSGSTQALKEITFTAEHQLEPGFLARAEYRRDFSNQRYFPTERQGVLNNAQGTATLGLVYWWGLKQGSW